MRQARAGKDRQLLTTNQDVETIHRRQSGLYELTRVGARGRVNRRAVDVAPQMGKQGREIVARPADAIEDATENVGAQRHFERAVEEAHPSSFEIEIVGALEHLNQHQFVGCANDLSVAPAAAVVANDHTIPQRHAGHSAHVQQPAMRGRRQPKFLLAHVVDFPCCAYSARRRLNSLSARTEKLRSSSIWLFV